MLEILPQSNGANIVVKASGIIRQSDYEAILPEFDRRCEAALQFRLLLDWEDLEGWDEEAIATSFVQRIMHRLRCERIAILSDNPRHLDEIKVLQGLLMGLKPRVFPPSERDAAWSWLTQDSV